MSTVATSVAEKELCWGPNVSILKNYYYRTLRKLPYVDESRMGVWGWGYGGYLTIRTLSQDSQIATLLTRNNNKVRYSNSSEGTGVEGLVQCGVAVAPVTQWQHHNMLWTQRYMGRPEISDNWDQFKAADLTK